MKTPYWSNPEILEGRLDYIFGGQSLEEWIKSKTADWKLKLMVLPTVCFILDKGYFHLYMLQATAPTLFSPAPSIALLFR